MKHRIALFGLTLIAAIVWIALPTLAPAQEAGTPGVISDERVVDMFRKGGVLMWPILLCSIVTLAFVFERLVALRASGVFPRKLLTQIKGLAGEGRVAEARELCAKDKSPFAAMMHACLMRADTPGFEMEAALEETGGRVLYDLRRNALPLGVIADVSPLLGLMGTVLGMIKAFDVVAKTGALGRAEMLAEGIGEALLTTAFGLSVAIPALIFYQYFRDKADGLVRTMEDACVEVLVAVRNHRSSR